MPSKKRKITFNTSRLRYCLKRKNYTNEKLCLELSISPNTFNKNMTDETIMPDILDSVCRLLDVDFDYIIGSDDESVNDQDLDYAEELKRNNRVDPDGFIIPHYVGRIPANTGDDSFRDFLYSIQNELLSSEKELFSFQLTENYIDKHFAGLKHAALSGISIYIESNK